MNFLYLILNIKFILIFFIMNHSLSQNKITEFLDLNLSKNSSKKFIRNMNDSKEKKLY